MFNQTPENCKRSQKSGKTITNYELPVKLSNHLSGHIGTQEVVIAVYGLNTFCRWD